MKIYVIYNNDDHEKIESIQSLDYYLSLEKTEELVDAVMNKRNKEAGWECLRKMEVTGELEPIMSFLLGAEGYKRYKDITAVYEKLRKIEADLDSMREDCFDMSSHLESTLKQVEKLVPEDER